MSARTARRGSNSTTRKQLHNEEATPQRGSNSTTRKQLHNLVRAATLFGYPVVYGESPGGPVPNVPDGLVGQYTFPPTMKYYEKVNPSENEFKFWSFEMTKRGDIGGSALVLRYGRIFTTGQEETIPCVTGSLAGMAEKRLREKMSRGYAEVPLTAACRRMPSGEVWIPPGAVPVMTFGDWRPYAAPARRREQPAEPKLTIVARVKRVLDFNDE